MHIHIFRLGYLKCCSSLDDGEDGVLLLLLSFTAGESSNIGRQSAGKNRIWPLTIVVRKGRWKRRPPGSNLLTWISGRWCLVAAGGDRVRVLPVASRDLLPSFRVEGASRGRHCSRRQGKCKEEPAQQGPAASLLPAHSRAVADAGWGG